MLLHRPAAPHPTQDSELIGATSDDEFTFVCLEAKLFRTQEWRALFPVIIIFKTHFDKCLCFLGCYLELNTSQGVLSSPGFGYSNYPDNLQCMWKVYEPNGRPADLMFHFFDTEKFFDYATVNNGSKALVIARYSGKIAVLPSQSWVLLTGRHSFTVTFTSDYSYSKRGFNATFSIG